MNQIIIGTIAIIMVWAIYVYNSLISMRNHVKKSFSGIDVQLKRRTDLIPNLVETVKGYAKHEKTVFENITKARTELTNARENKDTQDIANNEKKLNQTLKSLFAVAENYPDLKANKNYLELQKELTKTEDQIAASRRIYNENVTQYNIKIETFPNNLLIKMFKFQKEKLYETTK